MLKHEPSDGWDWFNAGAATPPALDPVCRSAAACLGTVQGRLLLHHLQRCFLDRRIAPAASDAELRHAEGQRSVVAHLLQLVERGRAAPRGSIVATPDMERLP
jgi:hypothetical protein